MREQVDRLPRLAEDLLDLTRLDAGGCTSSARRRPGRARPRSLDEFRAVAMRPGTSSTWTPVEPAEAFGDEERIGGSAAP